MFYYIRDKSIYNWVISKWLKATFLTVLSRINQSDNYSATVLIIDFIHVKYIAGSSLIFFLRYEIKLNIFSFKTAFLTLSWTFI